MRSYKTEAQAVEDLAEIFGPAFREYRKKWDLVSRFELETDFPMFLHIEPSYRCNLRCPMCTQGNPDLLEKYGYDEVLNTDDILKILKEGQANQCPSVSFQGDNEPFLIKEMPDWFKLAKEHGFLDIMVNTNGTVMTEKIARKVIASGLTRIRFSLDAISEETYNKIRIGAKFSKVMENVENFLRIRKEMQSNLPKIGVNFVRMTTNEHEIDAFIDYWNDKVDYIVIQEFMTPDVEGDFKHLQGVTKKEVRDFRCNQPWQRLYVRGNGDVTPCCAMFNSLLKLGDTSHSDLHSLWNSSAGTALRQLHKEGRFFDNPICLKCSKNGLP